MTTETKRDLAADLALCEATALGPWEVAVDGFGDPCVINETVLIASELLTADAKMIAESRQGWPHAIRRAMAAEAEVERLKQSYRRLHAVHDEQCARSAEYYGEIERLRAENERLNAFIKSESEGALDTFVEIEKLRKERDYWRAEAHIANLLVAELNTECAERLQENAKLRATLERMDDRRNAMMPRSVMARLAKETLDGLRDLTPEESARYEASLDRMFTKPAGNFFDDLEVNDIANED